jgi:hypothetical protein
VFADEAARARLNAIVHPLVRAEEAGEAEAAAHSGVAALVTDAALLVEAGVHLRFDRLVVVHCRPDLQLRRLMERDGLAEGAARRRIAAQMPADEKRAFAHFEVDTSGSLDDTDAQADALAGGLLALAERPRGPRPEHERAVRCLAGASRQGPRGLSPRGFLRHVLDRGELEMESLGSILRPPAIQPWYRALGATLEDVPPAALMEPLALWATARGRDDDALLAAAASVARLTHGPGSAAAGACFRALVVRHALAGGASPIGAERRDAWLARAERWGGGALDPEGAAAALTVDLDAGGPVVDDVEADGLVRELERLARPD